MKLVKQSLYQQSIKKPINNELVDEFIEKKLKLGSFENIFDKFLSQKEIHNEHLHEFVKAVIERIKTKWL